MNSESILHTSDIFRRPGTAQRELTRAPVVPSQDVSRYPAIDMPPPKFDLNRREASWSSLVVLSLAVTTIGAGIALVERIGAWLSP